MPLRGEGCRNSSRLISPWIPGSAALPAARGSSPSPPPPPFRCRGGNARGSGADGRALRLSFHDIARLRMCGGPARALSVGPVSAPARARGCGTALPEGQRGLPEHREELSVSPAESAGQPGGPEGTHVLSPAPNTHRHTRTHSACSQQGCSAPGLLPSCPLPVLASIPSVR